MALILACVSLLLILTGRRAQQEAEPETFFYGNRQLEVLEGVSQNQYDPAGFSLAQFATRLDALVDLMAARRAAGN